MKKSILILFTIATLSACSLFRKKNYEWAVDSVAVDSAAAIGEAIWTGENEIATGTCNIPTCMLALILAKNSFWAKPKSP